MTYRLPFSRCDNALAATDLLDLLERPSRKILDAVEAIFLLVDFAINMNLLSL